MTKMRIVAISDSRIWVQKWNETHNLWKQEVMNAGDFETMMKEEYPLFWNEYLNSDCNTTPTAYFYGYGQTGKYNEETFVFC